MGWQGGMTKENKYYFCLYYLYDYITFIKTYKQIVLFSHAFSKINYLFM